jgi:hypothetical protein
MTGTLNDNARPGGERRVGERRRVLLHGKLGFPHNAFSADCTIRDLSEGGARITLSSADGFGDDPWLIVVKFGVAHASRTVWTAPFAAGLQFEETFDLKDGVPTHLAHLRRLWVENLPR